MHYEKLYKKTATGAVQVWWQERIDERYRTHSGQVDGAITTSAWTVAKPKNVGRSNETTGAEQAAAEVASSYELKTKKGYRETITSAKRSTHFSPMLAHELLNLQAKKPVDRRPKVQKIFDAGGHCYVQPKLDGMRCIADAGGLWSRNGDAIVAVPHINAALAEYFRASPHVRLDGELYNHELKDDFPRLMSLVRRTTNLTEEVLAETSVIQYWLYDSVPGPEADFDLRYGMACAAVDFAGHPLMGVPTQVIFSLGELAAFHDIFLEQGYEGTMLRIPSVPYEQNKRSSNLLKYKDTVDAEFTIVEIGEGDGNKAGMAGRAWVRLVDGRVCKTNIMGDREYCRRLLEHKDELVGKQATVLFFGYTPDGMLRFPRIKVIHELPRW